MKKCFTLIELLAVIAIIGIISAVVLVSVQKAHACGFITECVTPSNDMKSAASVQTQIMKAVPIPQLQTSLERENISKRAQIFNTEDKISYIYLVSYGKVMAFFSVKGKVSSLQSFMVPTEKLVDYSGNPCSRKTITGECSVVAAPDIDGAYGDNPEGIFFFTTEGAYVEWKGDYMMSDQPLKLTTTPELVRAIQ